MWHLWNGWRKCFKCDLTVLWWMIKKIQMSKKNGASFSPNEIPLGVKVTQLLSDCCLLSMWLSQATVTYWNYFSQWFHFDASTLTFAIFWIHFWPFVLQPYCKHLTFNILISFSHFQISTFMSTEHILASRISCLLFLFTVSIAYSVHNMETLKDIKDKKYKRHKAWEEDNKTA